MTGFGVRTWRPIRAFSCLRFPPAHFGRVSGNRCQNNTAKGIKLENRHEVVAVAREAPGQDASSNRRVGTLERVCLRRVRDSWNDSDQPSCRAKTRARVVYLWRPWPRSARLLIPPRGAEYLCVASDPAAGVWEAPEPTPWSHDLAATERMPMCDRPLRGTPGTPRSTVGHWYGASTGGRNRRDVQ